MDNVSSELNLKKLQLLDDLSENLKETTIFIENKKDFLNDREEYLNINENSSEKFFKKEEHKKIDKFIEATRLLLNLNEEILIEKIRNLNDKTKDIEKREQKYFLENKDVFKIKEKEYFETYGRRSCQYEEDILNGMDCINSEDADIMDDRIEMIFEEMDLLEEEKEINTNQKIEEKNLTLYEKISYFEEKNQQTKKYINLVKKLGQLVNESGIPYEKSNKEYKQTNPLFKEYMISKLEFLQNEEKFLQLELSFSKDREIFLSKLYFN